MNVSDTIIFTLVLTIIALGLLIFLRKPNSKRNISFCLTSLFSAFWVIANTLSNQLDSYTPVLVFNRLIFFFTTLAMFWLAFFVYNFPDEQKLNKKWITWGVISHLIALSTLTPAYVDTIKIEGNYSSIIFGYGIAIYMLAMLINVALIVYISINKYRSGSILTKRNIRTFYLGIFIVLLGAIIPNFILPIIFNNFSASYIGPFFLTVFVFIVLQAIYSDRSFGFRFVAGKAVYIAVVTVFVLAYFYGIVKVNIYLFGRGTTPQGLILNIFPTVVFVYIFAKFNSYVQQQIEFRVIHPDVNPYALIEQFNSEIATAMDKEIFSKSSCQLLNRIFSTEDIFITIWDKEIQNSIYAYTYTGKIFDKVALEKLFSAMNFDFLSEQQIIFADQLPNYYTGEQLSLLNKVCSELNTRILLPLKVKDQIVGMIGLSDKKYGDFYTQEEANILLSLSYNLALGLTRAMYYDKVQSFASKLEIEVSKATADIQAKNLALEETLRKERDMLDILGHELRTPLTIAKNSVLVLKKLHKANSLTHGNFDKYLYMSEENIMRESKLLETLLSTTKIDNNALELEFVKVDFIDVVNDSLDGLMPKAEKKNLTLNFTKPAECFITADRNRVQEVVDNLIDNAIKYTPKGSVNITMTMADKDNHAKLEIQDTGIGISEDELQKIGQKFYRTNTYLESSKSHGYDIVRPGGTGLGLYVTFSLVKRMGGHVMVSSKVGQGSKFIITLPLFNDKKDTHESLEAKSSPRMTIYERFNKMKEEKKAGQPGKSAQPAQTEK